MAQTLDEREHTAYNTHARALLHHGSLGVAILKAKDGELVAKGVEVVLLALLGTLAMAQAHKHHGDDAQQKEDGKGKSHEHPDAMGGILECYDASLILTVLTGGVLQVEILVAIVVAHNLIVEGCIGHGHLFADARLEVGHGVDGRIGECIVKALQRGVGIANVEIAGGKVAPGIGCVVVVFLLEKDVERPLGKVARKERVGYAILVDISQRGRVKLPYHPHNAVDEQILAEPLHGDSLILIYPVARGKDVALREAVVTLLYALAVLADGIGMVACLPLMHKVVEPQHGIDVEVE